MRKKLSTLILMIIFLLGSCQNRQETNISDGGIIVIDLLEGLRNSKKYPVSHFVENVEMLELESGSEFYTQEPTLWHIGEKYILVFDKSQVQLFLFSREGEFIRKIGRKGQGPGEYLSFVIGTMDKAETKILVANTFSCEVIVYDIEGQVLYQKNIADHLPTGVIEHVLWNNDYIDFLSPKPAKKDVSYTSINQFNSKLDFIRGIHESKTIKDAGQFDLTYSNLFQGLQGSYFWGSNSDTVFHYDENGTSKPAYRLLLNRKKANGKDKGLSPDEVIQKTFVYSVNMISNHLVIWLSPNSMQTAVYYNLKTGETFSLQQEAKCGDLMQGLKTIAIENDLYGYEPVEFKHFNPEQNICPINIPFWLPFFEHRADCLQSLDVKQTDIRDQLYNYFKNPEKVSGMVLLVHHMKSE